MPKGVKLINCTVAIVLHNGEPEIESELACPADALRIAIMMLARGGRLEIGDALKVVAPQRGAGSMLTVMRNSAQPAVDSSILCI
jgi:hypothetical protein